MEPKRKTALGLTAAAAVAVTFCKVEEELWDVELGSPEVKFANLASGAVAPAAGYSAQPPHGRVDPSGEPPKFRFVRPDEL